MNSWWTVGRVIWVAIGSSLVIATIGNAINNALEEGRVEKTKRLREVEETKRLLAEAEAKTAQARAEEARWRAEEAATRAACDDCANFASRKEAQEELTKLQEAI